MGELIKYVHMAYYSEYEKYMLIDIKEGNVIGKSIVSEKPDNL